MPNDLYFKELENLSPEERKYAIEILKEFSSKGSSEKLNDLLYDDYSEIPVTIDVFLHNPNYLGKALTDEEGRWTIFPYWEDCLKKIFPNNIDTAYNTSIFTGAIGLGKSTIAVIAILYQLYRLMCLKNPYVHYGLQEIDLITVAFMNITIDSAKGVAWSKCQNMLQRSPWFMARGTMSKGESPEWRPPEGIELIYGSLPRHIIGRAVFACFFDEISFQPNQDVEKQRKKAAELVSTAAARMQSRFMKGEKNPTILMLASSKRTEQSYLETFIENKKKNESKTTLVVDEPQWVIRTDKDSPNKFKVAVGNKFLNSEVLPLNTTEEDLKIYRNKGFKILDVPMGYYENFIDDIDVALTDIAGISTSNSSRYISGPRIANIKKDNIKNPFTKEVIEVGNDPNDTAQYSDFFDMNLVDRSLLSRPLFVHLDMSVSGDKTGIAGIWIIGKKPPKEGQSESKDLLFRTAFSVSVKAPKGHQISFEKNRQFIYWLKEQGFAIKCVSSDTFQSVDTGQALKSKGFNYEVISVDRVDLDRICKPYQYLKSTIYEERIEMYENTLLTEELIGLERNNNSGKIDHTPSGINCFTGDTKVRLLDGRNLSMLELIDEFKSGKSNYVYSFNHTSNKIEPALIKNAWCSGHNAKLLEITLDNDETIRCTPEHRFMLRDGSYKEAKYLVENESLMPLYTKVSNKGLDGYRLYYEPMENKWHYEHRQFAKEILDEHYLVHHKDCNKINNSPNNLIWCSKKQHNKIHSSINTGMQSKESRAKRSKSLIAWHLNNKENPEYWTRYVPYKNMSPEEAYESHLLNEKNALELKLKRQKIKEMRHVHNQNKIAAQKKKQEDMAKFYNVDLNSLEGNQLQALMIKYAHDIDSTYQDKVSRAVSKNHADGKYRNAYAALQKCNAERKGKPRPKEVIDKMVATRKEQNTYVVSDDARKKISEAISKKRWFNNGKKNIFINPDTELIPDDYKPGRIVSWKNHKVKSIRLLDYTEDVYDLEIDKNHNFALSCGIFVHNSKDQADALCGAVWSASKHAEEFAFDYGETLETIATVSASTNYNSDRKQLSVDFEQELNKMFDPIQQTVKNDIEKQETKFLDFGMGKATSNFNAQYITQGIILF